MTTLLNDRDLQFLLYEFLDTEALLDRPRYADHSREIFDATLDTAREIAADLFAPHNAKGDANEPHFDGERVHLVPETKAAWDAFAQAGFLSAHWNENEGGLQMPEVVLRSAIAYFKSANVATASYSFLSIGAANLLRSFGMQEQKTRYLAQMGDGRFSGTMALTEPGQGSALGDITTRAELQADGTYRLFGQKMFISGGDHNLTDNIVHMVLARIKGAPAGVKGISLFLVPKYLVNDNGSLGARNDVTLAGLLHKMGWRNTTSTVLSFGEKGGAVGTLVGEAGKGLGHMFQMMNEARIGIGLCAAAIAYRAYLLTLDYARERPQGRRPSCKDPLSPQVKLIEHVDVRRMLLAQKAYAEGALAMCLYASSLFEDQHTHADPQVRRDAGLLLDLLTPVVKSWASKYGCASNDLAIQILGGSGYIREYQQEQLYRDQRLNPIHEGAEAIHGIDLLGRKVIMQSGAAYRLFRTAVDATLEEGRTFAGIELLSAGFTTPLARLDSVTAQLAQLQAGDPERALANAIVYLDAFGRIFAAWIWLKQALVAQRGLATANDADRDFYSGKIHAARYYCNWELPATLPQFDLLAGVEETPLTMQDAWF
ncbi:acyl-CoA dehydrogenase [Noviherbaspirillum saxi]|uniref:Acyl-CoA dehydrogenase n=1 Tax=Noviherbaspirillum saxi TaxID=2320863 RepID=A0A3A3FXD3_9BURK|nr:acyl-CoA dehydrogenase [Noviherbaspirillum saxi]RJG00035.1 acyl-CoA dehydrogenase [Noviherbaspirillum saxi]